MIAFKSSSRSMSFLNLRQLRRFSNTLRVSFISISSKLLIQNRTRTVNIKELNERAHKKGGTKADNHNTDNKAEHSHPDSRINNHCLQKLVSELSDIAQQEQIDKSCNSNVVAVENQHEDKKHGIRNHI